MIDENGFEIFDEEMGLIEHLAVRTALRYQGYVETDDVRQELYLWMLENKSKVQFWRDQTGGVNIPPLAKALGARGTNYARREQAAWRRSLTPQQVSEDYKAKQVRAALPYALTGLPHGAGSGSASIIADIKVAFDLLSENDQQILRTAVVYDYDYAKIAEEYSEEGLNLTPSAVGMRVSRSIKRLAKILNDPGTERDSVWQARQWKQVPRKSDKDKIAARETGESVEPH